MNNEKDWDEIEKVIGRKYNNNIGAWTGIDYVTAEKLIKRGFLSIDGVHDHGMTVKKMMKILKKIPELRANAIRVSGNDNIPQITLNAFDVRGQFNSQTVQAFFLAVNSYADDILVSPSRLYVWFD